MTTMNEEEIKQLEIVQNRLATSMIKQVKAEGLAKAGDWVQGGWSRSSAKDMLDKLDFGITNPKEQIKK